MTRGRKPLVALREAEEIGSRRGSVIPAFGNRRDPFDLILFEEKRCVFVRVKRSVSHINDTIQVLHQYRRDIALLHRIPLAGVTARELWVRSPRGSWQFFLVRCDSIIEIQGDGTFIPRVEHPLVIPKPDAGPSSAEEF